MRRPNAPAEQWMLIRGACDWHGSAAMPVLCRRALEPVPLALPRIRRKAHVAPASFEHAIPIDRASLRVQRSEGPQQRSTFVFLPAKRREHSRFLLPRRKALVDRSREHGMRRLFEQCGVSAVEQRLDARGETNRPPYVLEPVVRAERRAMCPCSAHGGNDRNGSSHGADVGQHRRQLGLDGIHLHAVIRHREAEHAREDLLALQPGEQRFDRLSAASHRARHWTVHRREIHFAAILGDEALEWRGRHADGEDLSRIRFALQPAAVIAHLHRVLQRERTTDVRRRHLACAVSDYGVRYDSPRLPHLGQRDLDDEVRHLREVRLGDA